MSYTTMNNRIFAFEIPYYCCCTGIAHRPHCRVAVATRHFRSRRTRPFTMFTITVNTEQQVKKNKYITDFCGDHQDFLL